MRKNAKQYDSSEVDFQKSTKKEQTLSRWSVSTTNFPRADLNRSYLLNATSSQKEKGCLDKE